MIKAAVQLASSSLVVWLQGAVAGLIAATAIGYSVVDAARAGCLAGLAWVLWLMAAGYAMASRGDE